MTQKHDQAFYQELGRRGGIRSGQIRRDKAEQRRKAREKIEAINRIYDLTFFAIMEEFGVNPFNLSAIVLWMVGRVRGANWLLDLDTLQKMGLTEQAAAAILDAVKRPQAADNE